jgi:hypothetical protein
MYRSRGTAVAECLVDVDGTPSVEDATRIGMAFFDPVDPETTFVRGQIAEGTGCNFDRNRASFPRSSRFIISSWLSCSRLTQGWTSSKTPIMTPSPMKRSASSRIPIQRVISFNE